MGTTGVGGLLGPTALALASSSSVGRSSRDSRFGAEVHERAARERVSSLAQGWLKDSCGRYKDLDSFLAYSETWLVFTAVTM